MLLAVFVEAILLVQPPKYHVSSTLSPSYVKPGVTLEVGFEHPQDPLQSVEDLYLRTQDKTRKLIDLNQMEGQVSIKDGGAALEFVRLTTSPGTFHLWDPERLEIQARERVDARFTLGDAHLAKSLQSAGSGFFGIVGQQRLDELGLGPAIVERAGDGFLVSRWVIEPRFRHGRAGLYRLKERVGEDGAYTVVEKKFAPESLQRQVYWSFPVFE